MERDGAFYLFALRLVPVFPFFVINLAMALTPMTVRTFYLVSQAGMLPGTLVYVNAGTQLGQIESLSGVLSPGLIASFVLLGVFPLLARKVLDMIAARKALRGHRRPKHFDRNLIVIGAGSAGLVAALIAATVKARVTLIERNPGITQGEVCTALGIQRANLVTLINVLEERGIVERQAVAADRRSNALVLTAEGRRLLRKAADAHRSAEAAITRRLGAA